MMEGPPLQPMINLNADPVAFHTPVPVPLHWQDDVKAGRDQDVHLGVIKSVPVRDPVIWCHQMGICPKKNQDCGFSATQCSCYKKETHHTQSPFHQAHLVPHNKKKTAFDCWNGYHSVSLNEDDCHLTTFITSWGRFHYNTAPQGYITSGDRYSH